MTISVATMVRRYLAIILLAGLAAPGVWAETAPKKGPIAGAGPDQRVNDAAKVILAGNGRVDGGRITRFAWTQVAGPRVELNKSNRSTANFIAPKAKAITVLKFRLTVTDSLGRQGSSVVTITVVPRNLPSRPSTEPSDQPPSRSR
jgi:hypothetical protein